MDIAAGATTGTSDDQLVQLENTLATLTLQVKSMPSLVDETTSDDDDSAGEESSTNFLQGSIQKITALVKKLKHKRARQRTLEQAGRNLGLTVDEMAAQVAENAGKPHKSSGNLAPCSFLCYLHRC